MRSWGKSRANSTVHNVGISDEYLAGFVDAEGSLMIAKFRATSPGKWYYRARASLDNVDGQVLKEIQGTYGGILFRPRRRKSGWRVVYKLVWTGDRTQRLLNPILLTFASRGNRGNSFYGLSNTEVGPACAELEPGTAPFQIGLSR